MPNIEKVEHHIDVSAPADGIYRLIAEVENWPQIFPPTIYVERTAVGDDARQERIRIWATANGEAKSWSSRRVLERDQRRVEFRQEVSAHPIATMGGTWIIEPLSSTESRIRLLHDYSAIDDDQASLEWIRRAVDENSRSELAALKKNIEHATAATERLFSFVDTVEMRASAKDVYDFINEADRWSERLPHVARVNLEQDDKGLQTLEMETRAKDGSTHLTKSYRVCLPHEKIAYKQITLPALMELHTGVWRFQEHAKGVTVSSQHTVIIKAENIQSILGSTATLAQAREYVHSALSTNSRATLGHAKSYAESRY